jgi:hypothetical protein
MELGSAVQNTGLETSKNVRQYSLSKSSHDALGSQKSPLTLSMGPPHSAVHCMPAKQFPVIVVEPVVFRRNDKDNPQAQNEFSQGSELQISRAGTTWSACQCAAMKVNVIARLPHTLCDCSSAVADTVNAPYYNI